MADGDPIEIGKTNNGTVLTKLKSSSTDVFIGHATATDGVTSGLRGRADSHMGRGVFGWATATGGGDHAYGVQGESKSPIGAGVYGLASHTDGCGYGVFGQTKSPNGHGVYGETTSRSGLGSGVSGYSPSPDGVGVYANNSAANGAGLKCHGHALPAFDNSYNCGNDTYRWKLVRAKTVTSGDLVFENGYRFTEDKHSGILLFNKKGERIARFDSKGNLHIKGKIIQDL